ncbi:hypothetical protein ACROYT_G034487 [Oculina patagonica]
MEVTRIGVTGILATNHVEEELSTAIVIAPIPHQQTKEEIAAHWDQLQNQGDVTHIIVQLMVVTRYGPLGLRVAIHVMEELRDAIVSAPIPHQHTEDETAGDWDVLQNHGVVTRKVVQWMEDIRSGLCGLPVASHVVLVLNNEHVRATIPRLQTEEHRAEDLLKKHRNAVPLQCAHGRLVKVLEILIQK